MNILEIEDMVKGLPDDRLQQEAEMPTGQVPQFLVVSEIQRRADMRKRFSERQQEQPQGTVKDQIVQEGIAAMAPPEPQMQAAMMGGPQPMPPQMPMQPEGPMPPQMPMAPQGPMPPQGMAEGGVVRMQEGMLTPYATALTNYQSLIEPLSQQLAMLQSQGGNVDKILDLEGQMRSIYENLGLDRYSLDEKRAALSDSSPEEIRSAYNRAGLNPDRYADIVGSIGAYAGEGEDNQDVNLPTATTPTAQEEPSDAREAFIRGEINTRSNPEGQFVASVDGPGTRDASSLIPRLEMQAAAPIDPESRMPERMQQRMRDIAAAKLNFLRRGDVQYDEEDLLRFAPSGPFFDASINQGGFEMATSPVARRLNSTLDRLEATSPTAKLARSLAAPAANDDRTQSIDVGGPLFDPSYTPRLARLGAGASGMSGNVAEITRGEADKIQLSGAVTTDAKRGLSTGTALDPEVLRLATAPDSSGGLQSIIGPRSGSNVADITRTEVESVEGVSTVRGGDASVQGPTGRQRAVATSTDASGPGGIPLPLYLRVLTSALGSNTSIDDSRRTDLENLIASAETKDNQGPLFGPDFTPKFGPDFTPKFGPPVPPSLGEQGPDFGPPIPPDVRVDGPAFGPDFRYKAQAGAELASAPIATTGDTTGTDVSDDSYAAIARKIDNLGASESGAAIDGTVSGFPTRTAYAPDYTQFQPNYREMIEAAETRAREARERGRREAGSQALIQLGAGIAGGDLPGGIARAGESARLARRDAQQDASADEQLAQRMLIAEQEARMKLGIEGERAKQEESKIADDYAMKMAEYLSARTDADRKFQLDKLTQVVTAKRYGDLKTESARRAYRDRLSQYKDVISAALLEWQAQNVAPIKEEYTSTDAYQKAYDDWLGRLRGFHENLLSGLGISVEGVDAPETTTDEGGVPPGANTGAVTRDSLGLRG